jgi:broad specificity phosphatase PhoE
VEHAGGTVVCVSHADVIKAVVAHHLGMALDVFQRLVVSPASITVLRLPPGAPPALLTINDTGAAGPPLPRKATS